jgi:hypothetical protein
MDTNNWIKEQLQKYVLEFVETLVAYMEELGTY